MNDENTPKEKEVKRRFQSWLRPSTIKLMDRLYEDDNCKSKSEFIEKAVRFYAGYLSTQNAREYLPNVVISTLKSIIAESDNRQNRMMFKLAVEIAIMQNLVAAPAGYWIRCRSKGCEATASKKSNGSTVLFLSRMRLIGRRTNRWRS